MLTDFRVAFRALRRSPGLVLAATATLAVGIGATTIVASWLEGIVLRPFPALHAPERLVQIGDPRYLANGGSAVSYPDYVDWRARSRTLAGLAAYEIGQLGLRIGDRSEPVWGVLASANYFEVLGARPALGRGFATDEEAAPVAVLGHVLWRQRFGADSTVIGRAVVVNGQPFTVIGVAPPDFGGAFHGLGFDLWLPLGARPALYPANARWAEWRDTRFLYAVGRLAPGVTLAAARAELRGIGKELAATHPEDRGVEVDAMPLGDGITRAVAGPVLAALLAVAALLLLVVCANVAGLLLARGTSRARELAVREALGASRARLIRLLLAESMLLAVAGGAAGLLLAAWGAHALAAAVPETDVPLALRPSLDARVVATMLALTVLTAVACGLAPALRGARAANGGSLVVRSGGVGAGRSPLRQFLVAGQLAIALVALASAGFFVRGLQRGQAMDVGVTEPSRVLLLTTNLELAGLRDSAARAASDRLLDEARRLPGVTHAALASSVPLGLGGWSMWRVEPEGFQVDPAEPLDLLVNQVSPDYFATAGIAIVAGRALDATDRRGGAPTIVVNETFARRFWPGQDPVGRRAQLGGRWATVVGVARDGKYRDLAAPTPPYVYLPLAQWGSSHVTLHVRAAHDPSALVPAMLRLLPAVHADLPALGVRTLAEHMSAALLRHRVGSVLLAGLGGATLLLAAFGVWGVVSYAVAQRTREIGLRMALGAAPEVVVRGFVGRGGRLVIAGLCAGLLGVAAAARLLGSLLPGVAVTDPVAIGGALLLLAAVALLATWLPARRASRVDPVMALRAD